MLLIFSTQLSIDMSNGVSLGNAAINAILPYLGGAVGIGITFSIIYYFISKILHSPEIEAKAKEYLWVNFENIVIVGGILAINYLIVFFISSLYGASPLNIDHIMLARLALYKVSMIFSAIYKNLFIFHIFVATISNISIFVKISGLNTLGVLSSDVSMRPLAGLVNIYEQIDEILMSIMEVFSFVIGRLALVNLSPYLFVVLLPFGVVLRAFPLTKTTGSSLIALAIVVYYIYPLSVLVSDNILFNIVKFRSISFGSFSGYVPNSFMTNVGDLNELGNTYEDIYNAPPNSNNPYASVTEKVSLWKTIWRFLKSKEVVTTLLSLLANVIATILGIDWLEKIAGFVIIFSSFPILTYIGVAYNILVDYLFYIVEILLYLVLVLLFEITISVTMFRNISLIIGGEVKLLGLSKLV